MKILVTGAGGQLGRVLCPRLEPLGEVVATTRQGRPAADCRTLSMDLSLPLRIQEVIHDVVPDVIVNAAAYTAVDNAEDEAELAHQVNSVAPGRMAVEAESVGALLVHFSTDYVFSGESDRPWRETDPTVPLNVYGRTKLGGEEAIRLTDCAHLILRTGWVYAGHGHNFARTMLRLGAERDALKIVDDQFGAPTWVEALSDGVAQILNALGDTPSESIGKRAGTCHLSAAGETTWYHYAESLFDEARRAGLLERKPALTPVTSAEFPTKARRPRYSVLDSAHIDTVFGVSLQPWQDDLARCVDAMARANRQQE